MEEFCELIERSIDVAFEQDKYLFRCYTYLKTSKTTRKDVRKFIDSATATNINSLIADLEKYVKGGDKVVREAYGHLGKPRARKILKYLYAIINDAVQYEKDRRPGRKKKAK